MGPSTLILKYPLFWTLLTNQFISKATICFHWKIFPRSPKRTVQFDPLINPVQFDCFDRPLMTGPGSLRQKYFRLWIGSSLKIIKSGKLEVCETPLNPISTFTFLTFRNSNSIITPIISTNFYTNGLLNDHVTNNQVDLKSKPSKRMLNVLVSWK